MRHLGGIISFSTIRKIKCKKLGRGGELNSQDKGKKLMAQEGSEHS